MVVFFFFDSYGSKNEICSIFNLSTNNQRSALSIKKGFLSSEMKLGLNSEVCLDIRTSVVLLMLSCPPHVQPTEGEEEDTRGWEERRVGGAR